MRLKFTDRQQLDLTEAQALADSAEDNGFGLVNALLFSSDYRVDGGMVSESIVPDGAARVDPGVFVKADGKFYKMATEATANVLTGTENQPANVWGTGQAADPVNPRKDIIVVSHQFVESDAQVKNFIDDSVIPPVQFTQTVNTRKQSAPIFAVLHGTPSATPSEPAVPSGFLKLATINVPALATTIVTANITNNLNINISTLEKLQQASQAQAAFSDILHSDGVYSGVLGQLEVAETAPTSMGVSVSTGVALKDGVTARINTVTTVPIDAASFNSISGESVTFNVDTKVLNTNGTPPHKIRPGTVVVAGKTEGVDYTINYAIATITRIGGGGIAPGGTISVSYDYYLPRIDRIEILVSNSTLQSNQGTPAQTPVAPAANPNTVTLAFVTVNEGVSVILNANISDQRIYLPDMDELKAARASYPSVLAHFVANEAAAAVDAANLATDVANLATHVADNATSVHTVHGIRQGAGNGFDADMVDGNHAAALLARANHTGTQAPATITPQGTGSGLDADTVDGIHASATPAANKLVPLDGSGKYQAADGSAITNLTFLPPLPTRQIKLTGSGATYTTPVGCRMIRGKMKGAGGGGGADNTNNGVAGGDTTFDSTVAKGGGGGQNAVSGSANGAGGSGGSGPADLRLAGNTSPIISEIFNNHSGVSAPANSGNGGEGGNDWSSSRRGGNGGDGEYVEFTILTPASSYIFTIGAGGAGGFIAGFAGGNGGSGIIIIEEYY